MNMQYEVVVNSKLRWAFTISFLCHEKRGCKRHIHAYIFPLSKIHLLIYNAQKLLDNAWKEEKKTLRRLAELKSCICLLVPGI